MIMRRVESQRETAGMEVSVKDTDNGVKLGSVEDFAELEKTTPLAEVQGQGERVQASVEANSWRQLNFVRVGVRERQS